MDIRFAGEPLPTMLSLDDARRRGLRVVVLEDGLPRDPGGLPGRARRTLIGGHPRKLATSTYISPNMVAQAIVAEFCRSGAIDALDRHGQGGAARATRRALRGAPSASCRTPRFVVPEGGYFLWVELPEGADVGPPWHAGRRGARRAVREGHRLPARGRREHVPHRLLGRHAGADRGGGVAPGGRLPRAGGAAA